MQENLLKLVRTLPTVLKFLPSQKAQDARNFVQVRHSAAFADVQGSRQASPL